MAARLGNVLYWLFSGFATVVLLFGAATLRNQPPNANDTWFLIAFFGISAVLVWLVGRACRYVLAAR